MIEKFSDYESTQYLEEEGDFVFEVTDYELTDSASGEFQVAKFTVKCDDGILTLRHSLNPKARWSYNNLIRACLHLTKEQAKTFELDYAAIGQQLVGKKFIGTVEAQTYEKNIKKPLDDGTFEDAIEVRTGYKIIQYNEYSK